MSLRDILRWRSRCRLKAGREYRFQAVELLLGERAWGLRNVVNADALAA